MGIKSFLGKPRRFLKKLDNYINTYLTPDSKASFWAIRGKMVLAKKLYGIDYPDYFQCRCDHASFRQLSQIVPLKEQVKLWLQVNPATSRINLQDKYRAFLLFKDYYQRDVVFVDDKESEGEFKPFCSSHPVFLVKPLTGRCGRGIQLINTGEKSFNIEGFLDSYPDGFVAEELIKQDSIMSSLHPESVNTVRINTVNYGTSIEVKWPCLRIGCGKSFVDNAGAGGVFGAIDATTGIITDVSDEFHHTYSEHPDTRIHLIGFHVPKWKEACEMAITLAGMIPDCHFVGWDLALTDKGWVMVEGNHMPIIMYQIATGQGIRKEFLEMKRRLLKK